MSSHATHLHTNDIVDRLITLHDNYQERFLKEVDLIYPKQLGEAILELSADARGLVFDHISGERLKAALEALDSDDATDLLLYLELHDHEKATHILESLSAEDKANLTKLKSYEPLSCGAYMQTEVFDVREHESIKSALDRLRVLKLSHEIENIQQIFITDDDGKFEVSIRLEDILLGDFEGSFTPIVEHIQTNKASILCVLDTENIHKAVELFKDYDIPSIPVVNDSNKLVGRITSDDIYDIIEHNDTKQIYHLAGIGDHSAGHHEVLESNWRARAIWLCVNLSTMLFASFVIGMFEATLEKVVALAILMPIIPALSGNAAIQALTVTVRKIAVGDITLANSQKTILRETRIALLNASFFSVLLGAITYAWFREPYLAATMALTVGSVLTTAGLLGASVPLILKRIGVDPAVGSSVIITGVIDSFAFFTLFGLATIILL